MPVVDGELVKLVCQFALPDDVIAQNAFYFLANFASSQTGNDVLDTLETWAETFYTYLAALVSDDITEDDGEVSILEWDATETQWLTDRVIGTITPTITFTNVGQSLPNAVAPTITAKTSRPRSNGRKAVLPFAEDGVDENTLTTAALTALGNAAAQYLTDAQIDASNTLSPVIFRRGVNSVLDLLTASTPSTVGSMRSRKPGEGA